MRTYLPVAVFVVVVVVVALSDLLYLRHLLYARGTETVHIQGTNNKARKHDTQEEAS
ncbi:uncharacterized protein K452DRAFT_287223 [Aplosporella prunicola CBS 121167]|uniref:Uncharacterized protein n=1 Tax=Aplosporella prunicola CBS 121167 TaxID=1176127 RepID=A0A6A6BEQ8_9PEZI|nr:uncharacterized protein K452DRAFT_287223 [Aplosporella prunicola CBS 121167]KAF2142028.1 hypothetical protein K452DRAFT_287223 [Aplosporella prunicola CBS 121167]